VSIVAAQPHFGKRPAANVTPFEETPMVKAQSRQPPPAKGTDLQPVATGAFEALTLLGQWNFRMAGLYAKRFQELALLPVQFAQCTSMEDVADVQETFSRVLVEDYREAAQIFAQVSESETARDSEAYAGILLKAQADAAALLDQAKAQARQIIAEAESRAVHDGETSKHGKRVA
jgi:hypothetical protein